MTDKKKKGKIKVKCEKCVYVRVCAYGCISVSMCVITVLAC